MLDMRTVTLSDKGQIAIPKQMREALALKKGNRVVLIAEGHRLVIQRLQDVMAGLDLKAEGSKTMAMSQKAIEKDWDNEYDDRWNKY